MIIIRRQTSASISPVDPTALSANGLWWDFASSPWVGRSSSGDSGSHNATEATNPPSVGSSLNTHASADFDGTNDQLALASVAGDYMTENYCAGWFLLRFDTVAAADDLGGAFVGSTEEGILTDASGNIGITASTAGFGFFRTSPTGYHIVHVPLATSTIAVCTYRMDLANNKIKVGINGPPNRTTFCRPTSIGVASRYLSMGKNYNGTARFDGQIWEAEIQKTALSDDDFRGIVASINARFSLSLSQASNVSLTPHATGTLGPADLYTGTLRTSSSGISARDGAKLHYFNGKYRLFGGWKSSAVAEFDYELTTNQVWSHNLGNLNTAWTLDLSNVLSPPTSGAGARWLRRHTFGTAQPKSGSLLGKLFIVGSDQYVSGLGDVWETSDGTTFTRNCANAPWGTRTGLCVGAYGSEIHVLGGHPIEASTFYEAQYSHFRSLDGGVTWEQLADPPFATAYCTSLVEHDGLLFVCGGNGGFVLTDRVYQNFVWAWDGSKWYRQTASAPWSGRMWVDQIDYNGCLWVICGQSGETTQEGDAWYSRDAGQTWTQVLAAPWYGTHGDGVCSTPEDGIVMTTGYSILSNVYTLKKT